jgi:hypothetical protein
MGAHQNEAFAALDGDQVLERVAGGNETEVYRSDDGRYVVKLKAEAGGTLPRALARAREMRAAAEVFADCMGPGHSIPSYFLIARDSRGEAQPVVVQPFLADARPLSSIDYRAMSRAERVALADKLDAIMGRAVRHYRSSGAMPDLYGRTSLSSDERRRLNGARMLPWRLWSFLVDRTLLRSHNLLLAADGRVLLIDYDTVRRGALYRAVYFLVRLALFLRDRAVIWWRLRTP